MNILFGAVACGIWPALLITGYFILQKKEWEDKELSFPVISNLALYFSLGLALWSVPMLLSAVLKIYSPIFFGMAGWILTILTVPSMRKKGVFLRYNLHPKNSWSWIFSFGLLIVAFLYIVFPNDSIRGGNDMGTYTNAGIYIAQHGRVDIEYPYPDELTPIFSKNTGGRLLFYRGVYHTRPTISFQFAQLFPLWLAQIFVCFGYSGLLGFNGLIAVLSLCLFYGLCFKFMHTAFATAATLFLAFNPSQIWMARVTLTEIPAQFFILAGILVLSRALEENHIGFSRGAALLFGLSPLIRIDNFFLLPLLFTAHLASRIFSESDQKNTGSVWLSFYQICLPLFLISVLYYVFFSSPYFRAMSGRLQIIGAAIFALLFLLFIVRKKMLVVVRSVFRYHAFQIVLGLVLFFMAVYAYWLRPLTKNHALFNYPGQAIHGTRTFEELSLINLGKYLTPFVVWAGIFGIFILIFFVFRRGKFLQHLPFLFIFCGFSLLYIWKPHIEPIHFWWIRRFVPIIIPGFILCAAVGSEWLLNQLKPRLSRIFSVVLILFLGFVTLKADVFILFISENKGYYRQLKEVASYLPENELILGHDHYNDSEWLTPLFLSFDRKVFPININTDTGLIVFERWLDWQRERNQAGYFIYEGKSLGLPDAEKLKTFELSKSYLQNEVSTFPNRIVSSSRTITLYKIQEFSYNYLDRDLGGQFFLGVKESGFHGQEYLDSKLVRWTDGHGKLNVPLGKGPKPKYLYVGLESLGPKGKTLKLIVNKVEVFEEFISYGPWSSCIDISHIDHDENMLIEIISDVFIPADVIDDSDDQRRLGVFVSHIKLSENGIFP